MLKGYKVQFQMIPQRNQLEMKFSQVDEIAYFQQFYD